MKSESTAPTQRSSEESPHIVKKKKKRARDKMSTSPSATMSRSDQPTTNQPDSSGSSDYHVGQIAALLSKKPATCQQQAKSGLVAMFGPMGPTSGQTGLARLQFAPRSRSGRERQDSGVQEKGQKPQAAQTALSERKDHGQQRRETPDETRPSDRHVTSPDRAGLKAVTTDTGEAGKERPRERRPSPEETSRTVFVGNLPMSFDKKKLRKLFHKFGEIKSMRFRSVAPADPELPKRVIAHTKQFHPDRNSMNSYVVYHNVEDAQKALKRNGKLIGKNHIRVDLASNSRKHDTKHSVFLGNLPFDVSDDVVREHFEECGTVENVRIIRDAKTGLGKGFGYLLFAEDVSVEFALKLEGSRMAGRDIRVQRATKQKQRALNAVKRLQMKEGGNAKGQRGVKGPGKTGRDRTGPRVKTAPPGLRRQGPLRKTKAGQTRSKGNGQVKRGKPAGQTRSKGKGQVKREKPAGRAKTRDQPKKGKRKSS